MKVKTGIDIIETKRIQDSINKFGDNFINRIFTQKEIEYCNSKKTQKVQSYAARFAAKEAVFKAISELLEDKYDIEWKDIEIINNEQGRPYVILNGKLKEVVSAIQEIDISISHIAEYAMASCVVTFK